MICDKWLWIKITIKIMQVKELRHTGNVLFHKFFVGLTKKKSNQWLGQICDVELDRYKCHTQRT